MSKELAKKAPVLQSGNSGTIIPDIRIAKNAEALAEELKKHSLVRGFVIVWQMQDVRWGRVEEGSIVFPNREAPTPEYWQELRVFNDDAELHLVRCGEELVGRFRSDTEGNNPIEYVDAMSRLWGERKDAADVPQGYVRLVDDMRGISMTVPYDGTPSAWCGLVTRNYIDAAEADKADNKPRQVGYVDYRFVRIVDAYMKGE